MAEQPTPKGGDADRATVLLSQPPWSIKVDELHGAPREIRASADSELCATLAAALALDQLHNFEVSGRATPMSRGRWRLRLMMKARFRQNCVVTLEPVESELSEPVEAIYIPEHRRKGDGDRAKNVDDRAFTEVVIDPDEDNVEPITRGAIVFGPLAYEAMCLAIDPYPRRSDVCTGSSSDEDNADSRARASSDHHAHAPQERAASPFAVLERLRMPKE